MCDGERLQELEREAEELRTLVEVARDALRTVQAGVEHFAAYDSTWER